MYVCVCVCVFECSGSPIQLHCFTATVFFLFLIRNKLYREDVVNCLVMIQPTLFAYSFNGPPEVCGVRVTSFSLHQVGSVLNTTSTHKAHLSYVCNHLAVQCIILATVPAYVLRPSVYRDHLQVVSIHSPHYRCIRTYVA